MRGSRRDDALDVAHYCGEMIEIVNGIFLEGCFDEAFDYSVAFVLGVFLDFTSRLFFPLLVY